MRRVTSRLRQRVNQILAQLQMILRELLYIILRVFRRFRDCRHGAHRLYRVLSHGYFAGQHDGRCSIVNRVGYIGDLRPSRTRAADH